MSRNGFKGKGGLVVLITLPSGLVQIIQFTEGAIKSESVREWRRGKSSFADLACAFVGQVLFLFLLTCKWPQEVLSWITQLNTHTTSSTPLPLLSIPSHFLSLLFVVPSL